MANQAGIQFNLAGLVQILLAKTNTVLLPDGELQLPADRATENAAPVKCMTIPSSELRKHLSPQARLFVAKVTAVEDPVITDEWFEVLSKVSPHSSSTERFQGCVS